MKKNLLYLIFFISHLSPYAQNFQQTIKGTVVDRDTKETLIGATVSIQNTNPLKGAVTDNNGNFRIEGIAVGRHTLKVSYLGYKEMNVPEILVSTGKETVLTIEMVQNVSELKEVKVVASGQDKDKAINSMAAVSARKLNMDDANRYAGGFYDPARMVSSFAGVSAVEGDGVNDIVIRGNSPRGLLWRLEGIEIPNPNHFTDGQGGTGGAISILSSHVLSTSDFFTGAFPAEYGNAFSGIMDLNLRKGNDEKREYAFQLGVTGTEFAMEGPLSKSSKGSYMINYRYSTLGYLSQVGLIDLGNNNLPPVYQDIALNLNLPTRKSGSFSFFAVGGHSTTGTEPIKDSLQWNGDDGKYYETENHWMGVAGLKHLYLLPDKKTFFKTVLATTYQRDKWQDGILDKNYNRFNEYADDFSYPVLRGSIQVNHRLNVKNTLVGGIIYSQLFYDMYLREYNNSTIKYDTLLNQNGNSNMFQSYFQWKHRVSDNFEVNTGVHYTRLAINKHYSIEPRLGLKWSVSPKSALNFGLGIHSRAEAISSYMALIPMPDGSSQAINRNIDFTKSLHIVAGYDYAFLQNWRLKLEAYYQSLYNIPVEDKAGSKLSALNFGYGIPDIKLVNKGKGYNYGGELTLEKFYTNDYYTLFTLSVFDSKYLANDNRWYNTVFNCRYVTNFLAGKDFKFGVDKQNVFGMNLKAVLRGGNRISPIDVEQSLINHQIVYDDENAYSDKLPAFYRFDLGTYFRINKQKCSYIASLDVQNITNHQNTLGYEFRENNIGPVFGKGLIPILNFRIEF